MKQSRKVLILIINVLLFIVVTVASTYEPKIYILLIGLVIASVILLNSTFFRWCLFANIFLYTVLNYGFSNIGVHLGNILVPIGELILIIGLLRAFLINNKRNKHILLENVLSMIIIILFSICVIRSVYGFTQYGAVSLRDSTHYIEMMYFIVVLNELWIMKKQGIDMPKFIYNYLYICLNFMFLYFLFSPIQNYIQQISPKYLGYQSEIPLFGNYAGTFVWALILIMMNCINIEDIHSWTVKKTIIHIQNFIVLILLIINTSRISLATYLILIVFALLNKRKRIAMYLFNYIIVIGLIGLLILSAGINIGTNRGTINKKFIGAFFQSYIGKGDTGMAEGVIQRNEWRNKILKESLNMKSFIFGQGFGMPLTDFSVVGGVIVREPHNSFLSVYARTGITGLLLWLTLLYKLFKHNFIKFKVENSKLAWIAMVMIISAIINGLAEPFFENPQAIIPFYSFMAILNYDIIYPMKKKNLFNATYIGIKGGS